MKRYNDLSPLVELRKETARYQTVESVKRLLNDRYDFGVLLLISDDLLRNPCLRKHLNYLKISKGNPSDVYMLRSLIEEVRFSSFTKLVINPILLNQSPCHYELFLIALIQRLSFVQELFKNSYQEVKYKTLDC